MVVVSTAAAVVVVFGRVTVVDAGDEVVVVVSETTDADVTDVLSSVPESEVAAQPATTTAASAVTSPKRLE